MPPNDYIVCVCAEVSKQQILDAVNDCKTNEINVICEITGAGIICGGCRPVIFEILKTYRNSMR